MMLTLLMLFGVITALFVYNMIDPTSATLRRDRATAAAFADVKQALIGWSAARTPTGVLPNARPGELPCPDMDNDGFEDGNCVAGAIGRVPWKTLGIPEPKDGTGETLWYAIAGPFRIFNVNNNPIHSDTKGNLTVNQGEYNVVTEVYSVVSTISSEAVAVIFSPGGVVGAQDRSCPVQDCDNYVCPPPASSTPICNPANYLETAASVNNSTTNGPFISAQSSGTFNDKLMAITTSDLMPLVEMSVAREVLTLLTNYKNAVGVYPWADCGDGASDTNYSNRNRIPWKTPGTLPVGWGTGGAPSLPNWLTNRGATNFNWLWVIYYSAGKNYLQSYAAARPPSTLPGVECSSCVDATLTVNSTSKEVVIIMTGPAGASRPSPGYVSGPWVGSVNWWGDCSPDAITPPLNAWQAYLEDPENNDVSNDRYVTPSSTAYTRDRLYAIP